VNAEIGRPTVAEAVALGEKLPTLDAMRDALALSLLLACNSSAPPSPVPAPAPPMDVAAAAPPAVAAPPAGPLELKAIAREPTSLSDGTEIEVISAGYAHGKDDRNMQDCRLEVRRGAERVTLSLERDDAPAPQVALGWRFTLETVSAYNPPTKCVLQVEPAP
jgi:hypothetical protein